MYTQDFVSMQHWSCCSCETQLQQTGIEQSGKSQGIVRSRLVTVPGEQPCVQGSEVVSIPLLKADPMLMAASC